MKPRIYADTSVIGGCFDDEFSSSSNELFTMFTRGNAILVLSELTLLELEQAPPAVKDVLERVPGVNREYLELSDAAIDLANGYVAAGAIGPGSIVDAQHIAIASAARVDVLVSWNFKHIVNLRRIHEYNGVNLHCGYPILEIRSPLEVLGYG